MASGLYPKVSKVWNISFLYPHLSSDISNIKCIQIYNIYRTYCSKVAFYHIIFTYNLWGITTLLLILHALKALCTGSGAVQLGGWLDHGPAWGQQCHDPVQCRRWLSHSWSLLAGPWVLLWISSQIENRENLPTGEECSFCPYLTTGLIVFVTHCRYKAISMLAGGSLLLVSLPGVQVVFSDNLQPGLCIRRQAIGCSGRV